MSQTRAFSSKSKPSSAQVNPLPEAVDRRLLVSLMQRLNDPVVARVFVSNVEIDPELKIQFFGAYLSAQETIKRSQIQYAKAYEKGLAVAVLKRRCWDCACVSSKFFFHSVVSAARWLYQAMLEYQHRRKTNSMPEKSTSAKVIMLPSAYKATGTDN